jgi:hypothetical protein
MLNTPPDLYDPFESDEAGSLLELVIWLLNETPTSMIPSIERVQRWLVTLDARPDASDPKVQSMIGMCEEYIAPYIPQ